MIDGLGGEVRCAACDQASEAVFLDDVDELVVKHDVVAGILFILKVGKVLSHSRKRISRAKLFDRVSHGSEVLCAVFNRALITCDFLCIGCDLPRSLI